MTHYYLSNETGTILAKETDKGKAKEIAKVLPKPVALHAVITLTPAPIGGSVSMVGVMEWFNT